MNNEAEKVVESIIKRGIDWFDPSKLDKGRQLTYSADAKTILESETFNNELNRYITDLMKFITYESKDFEQVLHTRSIIVGLESFKNRLKNIEQPISPKEAEDPHEAI